MSKFKSIDLDVVVCVKNRAESLERVLSEITSTIPFKDLIVVYGSSKDETKEIAHKYTKKVFWDHDRGLGAARNLGVRKTSSELVAMIDSDVVLTRNWYKHLVRNLEDPKVAAAMGTCIYGYGFLPIQRLYEYWQRVHLDGWGYTTNTIFRRRLVLEIGNFDETICGAGEDYDLWKRILAAGYRWVWDRQVVVYHPMSLPEYLRHVDWWTRASPHMHELVSQVRAHSLSRIMWRFAYSILDSFRVGIRLSFSVDSTMSFYIPLFEVVMDIARIKELKKILSACALVRAH